MSDDRSTLDWDAEATYDAKRAASLAGIPKSTLYYWASHSIWVPASPKRPYMRWSYPDLLALRLLDWLRRDKPISYAKVIPRTSMTKIRNVLAVMPALGEGLQHESVTVWVDPQGGIVLRSEGETFVALPNRLVQGLLDLEPIDLVQAGSRHPGILGPNLVHPRKTLRIIPGKLSSEPHVTETRVSTGGLFALRKRGLADDRILSLYPFLTSVNVSEAIALEEQLEQNLQPRVAA